MLSSKIGNKLIHLFLLLLFYMVMEFSASVIKFIIRKNYNCHYLHTTWGISRNLKKNPFLELMSVWKDCIKSYISIC